MESAEKGPNAINVSTNACCSKEGCEQLDGVLHNHARFRGCNNLLLHVHFPNFGILVFHEHNRCQMKLLRLQVLLQVRLKMRLLHPLGRSRCLWLVYSRGLAAGGKGQGRVRVGLVCVLKVLLQFRVVHNTLATQ